MSTVAIFDGPDIFDPLIFDTRIKSFFVTINDEGGNVSDLVTTLSKFQRTIQEGEAAMFDGPDMFDPLIFDTTGGGGSITDSVVASKSNPVIITEAAIVISDLLARVLAAKTTIVENVASSDSLARIAKHFRNIIEAGGGIFDGAIFDSAIFDVQFGAIDVSDVLTVKRGAVINLVENTVIGETLTRMLKSFRSFTENNTISDLLVRKLKAFRTFTENNTISDAIASKLKAFRVINEAAITVADAIAAGRFSIVTLIENTVITEMLASKLKAFRSITEASITVSDVLDAFKVVGRRSKFAVAWINKRAAKAFILKRNTNANADKRGASAQV